MTDQFAVAPGDLMPTDRVRPRARPATLAVMPNRTLPGAHHPPFEGHPPLVRGAGPVGTMAKRGARATAPFENI